MANLFNKYITPQMKIILFAYKFTAMSLINKLSHTGIAIITPFKQDESIITLEDY